MSPTAASHLVHWAQDVFDGENPCTPFRDAYQLYDPHRLIVSVLIVYSDDRSVCQGSADSSSLQHLARDGFIQALEMLVLFVRRVSLSLTELVRSIENACYCACIFGQRIAELVFCLRLRTPTPESCTIALRSLT